MTKVLIDDALKSQLEHAEAGVALCDQSGRTLGYFIPVPQVDPALYEWARTAFTNEEIERARNEPGELTIQELLKGMDAP